MKNEIFDVVIVGAGTAGLTAAITSARFGWKTLVLEKGNEVGPLPRGESMAYFPLEDEILGKGFIDSIKTVGPSFRRYHSPWNKKETLVDVHTPYRFFPWRPFIQRFEKQAIQAGAEIRCNSEVISPIYGQDNRCMGVKYKDDSNQEHEIKALFTIAADGHDSIIGKSFNIDYSKINCPIIKFLGDNANIKINERPNPQFFLISPGQFDFAPNFPPAAAYYFPIGDKKIEAGLMLRMGQVPKMKGIELPSEEEIMKVWEYLKTEYPGFSDAFKGIEVEYQGLTQMPNASLSEKFVLGNGGAILVGDSAGFVDANGSSGLYYGMQMAYDWIFLLQDNFGEIIKEDKEFENKFSSIWNAGQGAQLDKKFMKMPVYKHIKKSYGLIGISETLIFRWMRSSKAFNRFFWLFSIMIKSAS